MPEQRTYPNRYYRAAPYLGLAMVVGTVGCIVSYDAGDFLTFAIPVFVAILGFAGLMAALLSGWSLERSLRFFREGKALGRWEIEGPRWIEFARRRRREIIRRVRWMLVIVVIVVIGIIGLAYDEPEILGLLLGIFGVVGLGGIALVRLVQTRPYAPGITRAVIEVGPSVALINGHVLSFAGFGQTLTGVELDEEAQVMIIRGRAQTENSTTPFEHELPFPPEAVEEVRRAMLGLGLGYGLVAEKED